MVSPFIKPRPFPVWLGIILVGLRTLTLFLAVKLLAPQSCLSFRNERAEHHDDLITILANEIEYRIPSPTTVGQDFHFRLCTIPTSQLSPAAQQLKPSFKVMHDQCRTKDRNRIAHAIGFIYISL
jgi:hypothetical protein